MITMLSAKHKGAYCPAVNKLDRKTSAQILHLLCEGQSIRAVTRLTGPARTRSASCWSMQVVPAVHIKIAYLQASSGGRNLEFRSGQAQQHGTGQGRLRRCRRCLDVDWAGW